MEVKLTLEESLLVNGMILADSLEGDKEVDPNWINHYGACIAVAKAINIYPKLAIVKGSPYMLVGRTHARIQVVNSMGWSQTYRMAKVYGDTIVVVIGEMPDYTIAGYAGRKEVLQDDVDPKRPYYVYGHILQDFKPSYVFQELLNNSWDWTTAYEKDGDDWKVKGD